MYRKTLILVSAVLLCGIFETQCQKPRIIHKIHSSFLEKYSSYADAVILNFQIPPDLEFISLKFVADETKLSFFKCNPQDVSIYLKEGSPPVINPDGSTLPKRLLNNASRPDVYNLEIKSDKTPHYINFTSPIPGTYFAVSFISWSDPTNDAITQQGLTAECVTYVDAALYALNLTAVVDIIIPNENVEVIVTNTRFYKFYVPEFVDHAIIVVNSALLPEGGSVTLRIDAKRFPSVNNSLVDFVLNYTEDFLPYTSKFWTLEGNWHYLEITSSHVSINFHLKFFTVTDAIPFIQTLQLKNFTKLFRAALPKLHRTDTLSDMIPYKQYNLVKFSSSESFIYSYDIRSAMDVIVPTTINLTTSDFTVLKFTIQKGSDIGGTLQFSLTFAPKAKTYNDHHIIVGCIRRNAREIPQYPDSCFYNDTATIAPILLNKTTENSTIYIPYPETGVWYASFRLFNGTCEKCKCSKSCNDQYIACADYCEANCLTRSECEQCPLYCKERVKNKRDCKQCDCIGGCVNPEADESNSSVIFDISSNPCLSHRCGKNGRCVYMVSGGLVYSICVCSNNYRGWDCTDDSLTSSYTSVLVELLLLVLSNLAFIPATYFAFQRKYYIEAIVYGSLCFFSTFYHACDAGDNVISFCLTKVAVLQFADFFTALLAVWVTLIALADLPSFYPSILHMSGSIFLAFGTTADRRSLWLFMVPATCGVVMILVRWLWYYKKNRFLPISKRYLYVNLPTGLVLVSIGLVVFTALQTNSNYKFTHSLWHVVMAVAVVVLLPTKETFHVRNM